MILYQETESNSLVASVLRHVLCYADVLLNVFIRKSLNLII